MLKPPVDGIQYIPSVKRINIKYFKIFTLSSSIVFLIVLTCLVFNIVFKFKTYVSNTCHLNYVNEQSFNYFSTIIKSYTKLSTRNKQSNAYWMPYINIKHFYIWIRPRGYIKHHIQFHMPSK